MARGILKLMRKANLFAARSNDFADGQNAQQVVVRTNFLATDCAARTRASGKCQHQSCNQSKFFHLYISLKVYRVSPLFFSGFTGIISYERIKIK